MAHDERPSTPGVDDRPPGDAAGLESLLSRVFHDLRGSVLSIIGFSDLVLESLPDDLDPAVTSHVERISANAVHLQRQLEDLSALAHVRVGRPEETEAVPLGDIAAAVALELRHHHPAARIRVSPLPAVRLDHRLATDLLQHLLTNAVVHGGRSDVSVDVDAREAPEGLTIDVADDGQGIPEAERARVLEPFFRLSARPAGEGGTGIGLTISRRIVEAAGGRLEVGASPTGGALLRVHLPPERIGRVPSLVP